MTRDPLREIDVLVAELMGDRRDEDWVWISQDGSTYVSIDGGPMPYSTDIAACAKAEIEIIKRGLLNDYASAVMSILRVSCYGTEASGDVWAEMNEIGEVLTASPFVRALAMLRAVGVIK